MLNKLRKLFSKPPKTNVIILGTDFEHYQLAEKLIKEGTYHIVAFIDEEPWNHKTQLHGAPLKYPSELIALCKKHQVHEVISIENQAVTLTQEQTTKMHQLGVKHEVVSNQNPE